jgi:hypothetical protein
MPDEKKPDDKAADKSAEKKAESAAEPKPAPKAAAPVPEAAPAPAPAKPALVKMVRPSSYPEPRTANVHPAEVAHFRDGGWTEAQ